MKKKVILKDDKGNIIKQGEVNLPAKDHLEAQKKFPMRIFRNKKKYYRPTEKRKNLEEN